MPAVIYNQKQCFQIGGGRGWEEETSFIILLLNVSFGEERKRKPFTCLSSLEKR